MASWLKASLSILGLASFLFAAGCKQGLNEVCQVNADCEEGLQCSGNSGRCTLEVDDVADAAPTPDSSSTPDAPPAPPIDAASPDAAPADASDTDGPLPDPS